MANLTIYKSTKKSPIEDIVDSLNIAKKSLLKAYDSMKKKDYKSINQHIKKTVNVITSLKKGLNKSKQTENISSVLDEYYAFLLHKILQGQLSLQPEKLEAVAQEIEHMIICWYKVKNTT